MVRVSSEEGNRMKRPAVAIVTLMVLLVGVFAPGGRAQEGRGHGRLYGEIYDSDNHPVAGATVTLQYLDYNRRLTTVTNKKGQWAFINLGKGEVKVTIDKEGFISAMGQLNVSGLGHNPGQSIILRRLAENDPAGTEPEIEAKVEAVDSFTKGLILFEEHKYEAALALLLDFRQQYPDRYQLGVWIGNCYLELKRYEEALHELQTVVQRMEAEPAQTGGNSQLSDIYASIGSIYLGQNKFREAEQVLKKSIALDPTNYSRAYSAAEILFAAGNFAEAIRYYELALRLKPGCANCYKQLGYAYLQQGNTKVAVQNLEKYLELNPHSSEAPGIKEILQSSQ
jgi:tetratricopeptide (TPR) repeat protein